MNPHTHLYYVTTSDLQRVATETIGRDLNEEELNQVTEKILDRIQWYDPAQESIIELVKN